MSRTDNVIRNTIWGNINKIISLLLPFVVRTILIKVLGEQYLGISSLLISVINVLNLADLGFSSAIVFSMYKPFYENNTEVICALLGFYRKIYCYVGMIITVVGLTLLPLLHFLIEGDFPADLNLYIIYAIYLFNTVIPYFIFGYRVSIFYASQRNDIYFKILSAVTVIQYLIQILVLLILENYYAYIVVQSCIVIIQYFAVYSFSKKYYPFYNPNGKICEDLKRDIFHRVFALLGHKIGGTIIISIDSIIISSYLGLILLGKYSNYYYIVNSIIGITNIVIQASLSSIGNKILSDKPSDNYETFQHLSFAWNWVVSWCTICFVCLFQPFIQLWVGTEYILPFYVVVVLSTYYYAWQFRVMGHNFKDSAGLWNDDFAKPYIGMVANLILSILLVKITNDVIGVLIPTICVMVLLYFPWETVIIFRKIFNCKSNRYLQQCAIFLLLTIVLVLSTNWICSLLPDIGVISFIIKIIICFIFPNVVLIALFLKNKNFIYFISLLRKKVYAHQDSGPKPSGL